MSAAQEGQQKRLIKRLRSHLTSDKQFFEDLYGNSDHSDVVVLISDGSFAVLNEELKTGWCPDNYGVVVTPGGSIHYQRVDLHYIILKRRAPQRLLKNAVRVNLQVEAERKKRNHPQAEAQEGGDGEQLLPAANDAGEQVQARDVIHLRVASLEDFEAAEKVLIYFYMGQIDAKTTRPELCKLLQVLVHANLGGPIHELRAICYDELRKEPILAWAPQTDARWLLTKPGIMRVLNTDAKNARRPSTQAAAIGLIDAIVQSYLMLGPAWGREELRNGFCYLPLEILLQLLRSPALVISTEDTLFVAVLHWLRGLQGQAASEDAQKQVFACVRLLQLSPWLAGELLDDEVPEAALLPPGARKLMVQALRAKAVSAQLYESKATKLAGQLGLDDESQPDVQQWVAGRAPGAAGAAQPVHGADGAEPPTLTLHATATRKDVVAFAREDDGPDEKQWRSVQPVHSKGLVWSAAVVARKGAEADGRIVLLLHVACETSLSGPGSELRPASGNEEALQSLPSALQVGDKGFDENAHTFDSTEAWRSTELAAFPPPVGAGAGSIGALDVLCNADGQIMVQIQLSVG